MARSFTNSMFASLQPTVLGTLINDTFTGAALDSNWTQTKPNTTVTVNGGDLELSRAVGGGYQLNSDYLRYTGYGGSCLEDYTMTVNFKITEISASSTGFAIGVKTTATWYSDYWHIIQFNTNSGAGGKKLYFYMAGATVATTTSATALTCAVNDECTLTIVRSADAVNSQRLTATVTNITNPNSVTHYYQFTEAYPVTIGTPPTSYFSIFPLVGNVTLHNFTVTTGWYRDINMLAVGDSITRGLYSLSYSNRWTSQVFNGTTRIDYSTGDIGGRTSSTIDRLPEILSLRPRYILLMIGGNDLAGGVAIGTAQANYQTIVNTLTAAGIIVYHCLPTPRDATDYTTWNTWISSTYQKVIDTWTPLKGAGTDLAAAYDSGDGTHPNTAGHTLIANTILATVSTIV